MAENDEMSEFQLMRMMQNNPDFGKRIKYVGDKIKADKAKQEKFKQDYNLKYSKQIEEGTKKLQLLLEDGRKRGLSDDEIIRQHGKFVPSVRTPNLNWLFYFMGEHEDKDLEAKRRKMDKDLGENFDDEFMYENVQEPVDMIEYILGNANLDTFNKIKKLKTLATDNTNIHEGKLAEKKCRELCSKYDLTYEQIPI